MGTMATRPRSSIKTNSAAVELKYTVITRCAERMAGELKAPGPENQKNDTKPHEDEDAQMAHNDCEMSEDRTRAQKKGCQPRHDDDTDSDDDEPAAKLRTEVEQEVIRELHEEMCTIQHWQLQL